MNEILMENFIKLTQNINMNEHRLTTKEVIMDMDTLEKSFGLEK